MFNKFMKTTALMALPMAALLALTGCEEEETAASNVEQVNISETKDLFSQPIQSAQPKPLPTDPTVVIAKVNGEDITSGEVQGGMRVIMQQELQRFLMQAAQSGTQVTQQQMQQAQWEMQNSPQLVEAAKEMIIRQKLLDAAIIAAKIEVSEEDINAAIEEDRTNVPEGQDLESALAAQGMSMEQYTTRIKLLLSRNKFFDNNTKDVADTTETEAKAFYDENLNGFKKPELATASHILIKFEDGEDPRQVVQKLTVLAQSGEITEEQIKNYMEGQKDAIPPETIAMINTELRVENRKPEIGILTDLIETGELTEEQVEIYKSGKESGTTAESKTIKKAVLEKVRSSIIAGTISFADAAKQYSADEGSASMGGEYKDIQQGRMVPEFNDATFGQEIGEIGEPVGTMYGYHVIMVSERTEAGITPFEEAKEQIVSMLTNQKKMAARENFITGLRDSATIEVVTAP